MCVRVYECAYAGSNILSQQREGILGVCPLLRLIVALERGHPMDTTKAKASEEKALAGWH